MGPNTQTNIFNKKAEHNTYNVRFVILLAINIIISSIIFANSFTEKDSCWDSCNLGVKSSNVKITMIFTVIPAIIALYTSIRPFFILKKTSFKTSLKIILAVMLIASVVNIFITPTEKITYSQYKNDYIAYYDKDRHHFCELHANSSYCKLEDIAGVSRNVAECKNEISEWNAGIDLAKKYIDNGDYENCEEYPNGAICDRVLSTVEKYKAKKKISLDDLTNESFTKGGLNKNMDLSSCEEVITEEKSNLKEELRKLDEACDKNPKTYGCQNR